MGLFSTKPQTWMWTCQGCNTGAAGYDSLRKCEKDQIRHAKRNHRHESGYTVTSRGRVIYRVP